MRQLDDAGRDYEAMIAKEVAARVGKPPTVSAAPATETDRCAKCGTKNDPDADFCKKCGGKLVREAS